MLAPSCHEALDCRAEPALGKARQPPVAVVVVVPHEDSDPSSPRGLVRLGARSAKARLAPVATL